jgi:hypothetical protein
MSNDNKERGATLLLVVGVLILARVYWVYSRRWMQEACPCCNLEAEPLETVRLLAGMPLAFLFRYVWQRTVLRWAKGAEEVAPMTAREKRARLAAALLAMLFAVGSGSYLKGSMRAACLCCDMGQWPFRLAHWFAAIMVGMSVYYVLGLAIGRWAKRSKG